ncbi:hypothetical protein RAS1_25850 [Phycisphaerae bacterium RAS1]|nr:hypothetical protein RAS1_25850 [Phycisphaerae bacterium RAS1]
MATEAYIPDEITLAGEKIAEPIVLTFYDPDGDAPHGSLTTTAPLPTGARAGPLICIGRRDKKKWEVRVPEIEVVNRTAVGFEYLIFGAIQRTVLEEEGGDTAKIGPRLENLGATF